jgi:uncharacterized membrane protein
MITRGFRQRLGVLRDAWRTQLWPVPAVGVGAAIGLGVGLPRLDAAIDDDLPAAVTAYLFSGGPEAARTVLSVLAGSLITVTSLTFSLTVVTLQLASSQFSPRLLRTFSRDRLVHAALAVLLATFTYAVTVVRTVRSSLDNQEEFVPQVSVTVAYLLGLVSVMVLVLFLAHLARQIRVESLLREVHVETAGTMRRVLDRSPGEHTDGPALVPPVTAVRIYAATSGFLTSTDDEELLAVAVKADALVVLDRLPGDSLVAGTPIGSVWPAGGAALPDGLADQLAAAVRTGFERTAAQDIAFGLRQLVDVAVKALSPGVNDPTTAVHALGHASALLCEAAVYRLGDQTLRDDAGRARVSLRSRDLDALLELAVSAPRRYGAGDPDVLLRLLDLLREVAWCTARPQHHRAIRDQLDRLRETADRQSFDAAERQSLATAASLVEQALAGHWPSA